ncbi:helix-turn-helix transcriptional regulator [Ketogulonicigenium vulgare]|uniref:Putative AraC/XylS family transcription factor n=1 Tax=Ketogulonicigenium vulgare (strain WSH-001) TaxID=759362 RepID=F9Y8K6_KETVW|nr:AraC family transcriptional regulator [Ketogulonicigenium vulgare]ADO42992.1 HTH-type transcriptional regulator ybfI [Ketogulonicigenium vulgare Y25]AEM41175.1 putative AraC/XylS family transcription factor [Ketogulonicigenium vulgare WSH-001]ALJ81319.1 AraC family transcriptional regulator [Ketogulonicigenium vulgare]ANW34053.1 AraC family transcriptional regulator [Ketogulonicigenium vulgare]AOZ54902.1 HTH-type transcriptional regulator ybfI [Ketogulonicigenium vulgare]
MSGVSMRYCAGLGGFDALESRVARFGYSPHRHAEVVIAAYGAGHKRASCGRDSFDIRPGDLLVVGPETLHSGETGAGPGWHYLSIYLRPDQIAAATGLAVPEVETRVAGHRLHQGIHAQDWLRAATSHSLALSELLVALFAAPGDPPPMRHASAGLLRVRDRLADDPASAPTLTDLAALADMSPAHLSRQFRAIWGLSPFQFLTANRTRLAHQHIAAGAPLADVAHTVGFADQSHLNRWFKRIYGVTPGAFAASRAGAVISVQDPRSARA